MSLFKWLDKRPVLQCVVISGLLNLIIEILSRRSIVAGFGFVISEPIFFLYNTAIILLTLALTLAVKRRYFALTIASLIWIALGVTNFVLLSFRTTPLSAIDFELLKSVDSIISMYLNSIHFLLITVTVLGVIAGIIYAWIRSPKKKPNYLTALAALLAVAIFIASSTTFLVRVQALSSDFGNLADAYHDYGFAYCFSRSLVDRGITQPEGYSEESILGLLETIGADETFRPNLKPNIIMVQLESFFDVNYLKGLNFSKNPVPVFSKLKESFPHGFLTVPSIGAGTANTEFEILTGMNLSHFGAGEYPYKTVLQDYTTESIPFNLAELGYTSHAIHNHQGTFYQRHTVFSNLGFDTYTSLEYMKDVEYSPVGWAKDEVLTGEIMKSITSTPGQDFVYAISVQAHGKYPRKVIDETQRITATGFDSEEERTAFEYFVNQVYETDVFVGELIEQLEEYEEPVVLVLFGDHLPSLNIEDEDLSNGDRFDMEYIIWSNFDLQTSGEDLTSYQLSSHLLNQLGMNNGLVTKLHQSLSGNESYQESLEMLEYDMIYGQQFAFGAEGPHLATELRMGVSDIIVTGIKRENENTYITGAGFTEWSQVFIDDVKAETTYLDEETLMVSEEIEPGEEVVVAQMSRTTILSKSNSLTCPNTADLP